MAVLTRLIVLLDFPLQQHEEARSVACLTLPDSDDSQKQSQYFAVGTAFIEPDQEECTRGRLLLFAPSVEGKFSMVYDTKSPGAVHSIGQLPNGKFAITANSHVSDGERVIVLLKVVC